MAPSGYYVLQHSSSGGPGTWRVGIGGQSVYVVCPECKMSYAIDHDIADNGELSPSLMCPTKGCGWHVTARLRGWR